MTKTIHFSLIFLTSLVFFSCQSDKAKIGDCFNKYKSSILKRDGLSAVDLVDRETTAYYSEILEKVKTLDSSQLDNELFWDKVTILKIRHVLPRQEIDIMTGRELFIRSIDRGLTSNGNIDNYTLGKITVANDSAKGERISNDEKTPFLYLFCKENGTWKVRMHSLNPFNHITFRQLISDTTITENEYIFKLLKNFSGKKPSNEIWSSLK